MVKRTKTPIAFSPREIKRLHQRLAKRTITDFWDVGRILNQRFDERFEGRAPFGGLEKIAAALKAFKGSAPTSLSQLHQCRLLYETWGTRDVEKAEKVSLPWSRAIVFITVWAKAKELGQSDLITRCRTLIAAYPGRDRKKLKTWTVKVKAVQKASRAGLPSKSKSRHLLEKKFAAVHRLRAAAQIIDEMREFLPTKAHSTCLGLKVQAEGLIALVEMLSKEDTASR